jgi:hypothetical protein
MQNIRGSDLPEPGRRSKSLASLWGGVLRGVFLLKLKNGEEDGLKDVDVRLKRHNMALNGAA